MARLTQRVQRIKPSPTLAIDSKAKQLMAQGVKVINFGAGEPDFDTPEPVKEAAIKALKAGKTKYTPVGGIPELKTAIINKLQRDNGLTYIPEEILVSCGGKHALYNIAQVLFEAGDEVIIPAPFWVSYPDQVLLNDATPVVVPTQEKDGFCLQPEDLERAITPKTKAFILNSPSNPTGGAYSKEALAQLAQVLEKHNLLCISDEIYEKIIYDGFEHVSIAALSPRMRELTLVVNGASKVYSMTGWRMGYSAGPKDIIAAMTKVQGQVTTNINSITQWAAVEALSGPQDFLKDWVAEFKKRRDFIVDRFRAIPGVTCFKPQGAFYVFPNIRAYFGKKANGKTIETSDDLANYLLEQGQVAVVAGSGFGAEGYVRLSYATSMANIEEGMTRIAQTLSQVK